MAQTPIRVGSIAPQLQSWEVKFSPTRGAQIVRDYKGVDLPQMIALSNTYSAAGYTGSIKWGGAMAELRIESGDSSTIPGGYPSPAKDIIDKWEIGVDQEKPDLFKNVNWLNLFTAADAAYASFGAVISFQVAHVIRALAGTENATWKGFLDVVKGQPDKDGNYTTSQGKEVVKIDGSYFTSGTFHLSLGDVLSTYGLFQAVKYFVDDYFAGGTNYIKGAYVLRHTTTAPSTYAANVTDFNVEKLYRISDLLSEVNNASLWVFPLPGYLNYKILNYPAPLVLPPNYYWSALKQRASATASYRNRIEITQEYIIDSFGRHTYPLAYP